MGWSRPTGSAAGPDGGASTCCWATRPGWSWWWTDRSLASPTVTAAPGGARSARTGRCLRSASATGAKRPEQDTARLWLGCTPDRPSKRAFGCPAGWPGSRWPVWSEGVEVTMTPDPAVGAVVAGYRIVVPVGRGGMGVVYLAEEVGLGGRAGALKLLPLGLAGDPAFRERFLREMRVAAAIDHPNIIPVYRAGGEQRRLYIATRY